MGSRLTACFSSLRESGRKALIPFFTAGFPNFDLSERIFRALLDAGADAIEIGVPFSDPIAEGPTIQRSSEIALQQGASLYRCLELVRRLRSHSDVPLILMGYANPFLHMGVEPFVKAAGEVGVDGVIIPDLPPEEGRDFYQQVNQADIAGVLLAAPTTTEERGGMLMKNTSGFLYYVSLAGVTGARQALARDLEAKVTALRSHGSTPICVGFGISTKEQVAEVSRFADGVVVGSALLDRVAKASDADRAVEEASDFLRELRNGLTE